MKKKAIYLLMAGLMTASIAFSGCGQQQPAATDAPAESPASGDESKTSDPASGGSGETMVGYAVMRMVDEYWGNQIKGMQSAVKADGDKIKLEIADSNNDGQVCLENALSLLSRGAKVLIVSSPDPQIGAAIMEKAAEKNVPVISSDVYLEGSYFLTHDEIKAGEIVGDFAADYFKEHMQGKKAKVAILTHAAVAAQVDQRIEGFKKGFSAKVSDAEYLPVQDAEGLREKGANLTADIITANPDVNIVFGINDDIALGAASTVEAKGLSDQIACFGQGGIGEASFRALLDPKNPFKGTAAFLPFGHGEAAINQLVLPLLKGETPEKTIYSPLEIANGSNAQKFLDDMQAAG